MPRSASQARCVAPGEVRTSSTPALSRALSRSSRTCGGRPCSIRAATAATTSSTPSCQAASSTPSSIAVPNAAPSPGRTTSIMPPLGVPRRLGRPRRSSTSAMSRRVLVGTSARPFDAGETVVAETPASRAAGSGIG
ncbi:hypothetical protein [Nonomuraea sp. NPDC049309]|uniref:hypothetical protein n=1 Tax=Nonomuraea sp. NPDC049309 TaxID=3364350 RepID=UPI0037149CAF